MLAAGPEFIRGQPVGSDDVMLMLMAMLAGPSAAGAVLTYRSGGARGLRELISRMGRWNVKPRWYAAALLFPPVLILLVLFSLMTFLSPGFATNILAVGIIYGLLAGFFEDRDPTHPLAKYLPAFIATRSVKPAAGTEAP